jgi:hypothetical protein
VPVVFQVVPEKDVLEIPAKTKKDLVGPNLLVEAEIDVVVANKLINLMKH